MGQSTAAVCFLADATLGKLAKWLRLLGFDARYHAGSGFASAAAACRPGRVLLTRTGSVAERFGDRPVVLIREDDPAAQLAEVVAVLGLSSKDLKPFSRCLLCNRPTRPVSREKVRGRVPDYVWETEPAFTTCDGCRRIFWPGTHTERALEKIRSLFDRNGGGSAGMPP